MNIAILGAAGFIGTNLALELLNNGTDKITLIDKSKDYFTTIKESDYTNLSICEYSFDSNVDFDEITNGQDIIYHLVSSVVPTTSNRHIAQEIQENVVVTANLLDSCVKNNVKKVVFISSGGTVYGKEGKCPLPEETPLKPITSYGIQKMSIERLLYLYNYMYNLDYRVIRLSNPYGPYQRPNGILGAVTTFTYKALKNEPITIYGDGSVIRDFIYIDDAVKAIMKIVDGNGKYKTYNLGCGYGTSIKDVVETIISSLNLTVKVEFTAGRKVDVPINYLDISRYEAEYGKLNPLPLVEGIKKTADFMKKAYSI